jgi:hypothetical protein
MHIVRLQNYLAKHITTGPPHKRLHCESPFSITNKPLHLDITPLLHAHILFRLRQSSDSTTI